jgi:MFS family permease
MMSLNSTVVAPALSVIATDLNALSSQTWIATAYLVAVNAFQPLAGKVSSTIIKARVTLFNTCLSLVFRYFRKVTSLIQIFIAHLAKYIHFIEKPSSYSVSHSSLLVH